MGPEHEDLTRGVKLAAIALVSAVLTASLIIGIGEGLRHSPEGAGRLILVSAAR